MPSGVKWSRTGLPTALQLVHGLMALNGDVSLARSQQTVSQMCECSIEEADHFLCALRDQKVLVLTKQDSGFRWSRP